MYIRRVRKHVIYALTYMAGTLSDDLSFVMSAASYLRECFRLHFKVGTYYAQAPYSKGCGQTTKGLLHAARPSFSEATRCGAASIFNKKAGSLSGNLFTLQARSNQALLSKPKLAPLAKRLPRHALGTSWTQKVRQQSSRWTAPPVASKRADHDLVSKQC